jgi:uncharacterized protein
MKFIARYIQNQILEALIPQHVCVLMGARRTGKTELIKRIIKEVPYDYMFLNGEDMSVHELLQPRTIENYKLIFGKTDLLVIDEAQKIPEIGLILKLLADHIEGLRILVTGSSAFDMRNRLGEPLTGRKTTFTLYPFAQSEYSKTENIAETRSRLEHRLVYGNYPELIHYPDKAQREKYLHELSNAYLLKDILEFEGIKNADKIRNLLRLLAYQVGSEVSLSELANNLEIHKDTVASYLDLLSKVFVIFKLEGFSRNLRKEITKMSRWYFFDNGIRNTLINNMNDYEFRNDKGILWENYLASERVKYLSYNNIFAAKYFWRTYDQQEIDWVEEYQGEISAFEFKANPKKQPKAPAAWSKAYPDASFQIINPSNYLSWIDKA